MWKIKVSMISLDVKVPSWMKLRIMLNKPIADALESKTKQIKMHQT
ncbi:hypothetical protein [Lactobacillus intestinalis]|nr:hypothetical protein [Lactobacillus intestinalis]UTW41095.1 hypothetical protein KBW87_08185 [Lactobacillus intestinalis]